MPAILCYGDSNTWGFVPPNGERYPYAVRWTGVMAGLLGSDFQVIEEGQNGRTTVWDDPLEGDKNGLSYLPACLDSHRPLDLVIIMLGSNDLKARFSVTALDISLGVERLVQLAQRSACGPSGLAPKILLASPPHPQPVGELSEMFLGVQEKFPALAHYYQAVAGRNHCAFIDTSPVVSPDPADGLHLSSQSHEVLGRLFAAQVRKVFDADSL